MIKIREIGSRFIPQCCYPLMVIFEIKSEPQVGIDVIFPNTNIIYGKVSGKGGVGGIPGPAANAKIGNEVHGIMGNDCCISDGFLQFAVNESNNGTSGEAGCGFP